MESIEDMERKEPECWMKFQSEDTRNTPNDQQLRPLQLWIMDGRKKSELTHTLAHHFSNNKEEYAKNVGFRYYLLKNAGLNAIYSLRESLFQIVRHVWRLNVDEDDFGLRSEVQDELGAASVKKYLGRLDNGDVNDFLSNRRNPQVHQSDLHDTEGEDLLRAIVREPQPRIEAFIEEFTQVAEKMEYLEQKIIEEAMKEADYTKESGKTTLKPTEASVSVERN